MEVVSWLEGEVTNTKKMVRVYGMIVGVGAYSDHKTTKGEGANRCLGNQKDWMTRSRVPHST